MEVKFASIVALIMVASVLCQIKETLACDARCDFHAVAFKEACCAWERPETVAEMEKFGYASAREDLYKCLSGIVTNTLALRPVVPKPCCNLSLFRRIKEICGFIGRQRGHYHQSD